MKKQGIILGLLLACFQFASAQFTLEGEFRPRTEMLGNGQRFTATEGALPYLQTSIRAALNATYKTESYKLYMGVQEVFFFGDRPQISAAGNGNFRVQEAWADLKLSDTWSFKIGRQPLSYDDQRILGGLGWAQQARTHDVGIFKHKSKSGFALDAGYSLNTYAGTIYDTSNLFSYRELAFVHANKSFGKFSLSGLLLNTVYQNTNAPVKSNLLTAGIHAKLKAGILGLSGNLYIQDGQRAGEVDVKGKALFGLDATIKATDKFTVLAGFESIAGRDDDSAAFFPLYGTNHKFNGLIDRFYVGNHANAGGLVDLNIGAKFKLGSYAVTTKFHNFTEQSLDKESLGNELDIVVAKGFKGYKVVGGYSHFFEPSSVTGAGDTQNWAWLMLIIKPKFL